LTLKENIKKGQKAPVPLKKIQVRVKRRNDINCLQKFMPLPSNHYYYQEKTMQVNNGTTFAKA
jgi:hypothetical protein